MPHAVNWFQIQGPNAHALQQFYKKIFGWKMKSQRGSDSVMVAAEPGGIAGGVGTSHSHQPNVTVYISVGDIDTFLRKIQRSGGRMVMAETKLPRGMGSIAEFSDPAGNSVGLWVPGKTAVAKRKSSAKKAASKKVSKRLAVGATSLARKSSGAKKKTKK